MANASIHLSHAPFQRQGGKGCLQLKSKRRDTLRPVRAESVLEKLNNAALTARLEHLESQACTALLSAASEFKRPVFPCALIAGDVIILHLLHKLDLLDNIVKVAFIDTFHLFPETLDFLDEVEKRYSFKAEVFRAKDFANKAEYKAVHGSDLPIRDIDEYDRICKVEPFVRALATLQADVMVNGRRRDHGAERAHLQLFDVSKQGLAECQPLAYWEFEDVFNYAEKNGVGLHPLHEQGYPSLGDVHSTLPVDRTKWFEYGGERSGRFQGLKNKDGSDKTECGIHTVGDAAASSLVRPAA